MLTPPVREFLDYSDVEPKVLATTLKLMGRPAPREFRSRWCETWTQVAERAEHEGDLQLAWQAHYLAQRILLERSERKRERYDRARLAWSRTRNPALVHQIVATAADGEHIAGELELPPTPGPHPLVLVVPGATGTKEDFVRLVDPLLDRGYAVLRMDIVGFGETTGALTPARFDDAARMLTAAVSRSDIRADDVHAFGFCMGGALALIAAGKGLVRSVVTVSSMHDLRPARSSMGLQAARIFAAAFGYEDIDELLDAPAASLPATVADSACDVPVLVVHGAR
jgi:dienelactone hydrolase